MNIKIAAFTVTQKLNYTFFNDLFACKTTKPYPDNSYFQIFKLQWC